MRVVVGGGERASARGGWGLRGRQEIVRLGASVHAVSMRCACTLGPHEGTSCLASHAALESSSEASEATEALPHAGVSSFALVRGKVIVEG